MNGNNLKGIESEEPMGAFPWLIRSLFPIGILLVGWIGYSILSIEPDEEKRPMEEPRLLKTTVRELHPKDYQTTIRTQGIIRPHNEVTLTAQVSGKIVRVPSGFQDGAFFEEDEVLLELDPADFETAVAAAEARVGGAKASLQLATVNHERTLEIFNANLVSQADVDLAVAGLAQAQADLDSAAAQLERANRDLERTKIRAPFDGRVRQRLVGLGQTVGGNTPLGTIFSVDFAEVRLPITGRDLPFLNLPEGSEDAPVEVELRDALNYESETVWRGAIVRTEGALDESSLDLFAIARVIDPFGRKSGNPPLRIGQPVVGTVAGRVLKDVYVLPRVAVSQVDRIYLVDRTDLTLDRRTIKAIWSDEQNVIIRDPNIESGSWLATSHLTYSPDNSKVEIINQTLDMEMEAEVTPDSEKETKVSDETGGRTTQSSQLSG